MSVQAAPRAALLKRGGELRCAATWDLREKLHGDCRAVTQPSSGPVRRCGSSCLWCKGANGASVFQRFRTNLSRSTVPILE